MPTPFADAVTWTIVILMSGFTISLSFLIAYYLLRLRKRLKEEVIQKRFPILILILNGIVMAFLWMRPLMYVQVLSPQDTIHFLFERHPFVSRINNIATNTLWWASIVVTLTRLWLIYYRLNYNNSLMNEQWIAHLDSSLIAKDFWLKYKTTLGSQSFIMKIAIGIWLLCCMPSIVLKNIKISQCDNTACMIYWFNVTGFVNAALSTVTSIFPLIILYSYKRCKMQILDHLYLRYEMEKIVIILIVLWISFITSDLFITYLTNKYLKYFASLILVSLTTIGTVSMALLSTATILHKTDKSETHLFQQMSETGSTTNRLSETLMNEIKFEFFIQHLCKEIAMEGLLCFIAMMQFKYRVKSEYHILSYNILSYRASECSDDFNFDICNLNVNKSIPRSTIVFECFESTDNATHENELRIFLITIAHKLYMKYIHVQSELAINISYDVRHRYMNEMHDLQTFITRNQENEPIELFELFDEIIKEMYYLMLGSFERFEAMKFSIEQDMTTALNNPTSIVATTELVNPVFVDDSTLLN